MRGSFALLALTSLTLPIEAAFPALVQSAATDYEFSYTYPAEARRIAPLRKWLDADRAGLRAKTARDAAASRRNAAAHGFPFHRYQTQVEWQVVTDTPRFLSLSTKRYIFTGGAHGQPSSSGLLWDKTAGQRIDPKAVFASLDAVEAAVRPTYCARLKAERNRRFGPVGGSDVFAQCPRLNELTVLLGSTDRRAIDRIGLIADPYVAGSYAEGTYDVTLPVTPALLRIVKPAYRTAFHAR